MAYTLPLSTLAERYVEAWNAPDADARWRLLGEILSADAVYLDPYSEAVLTGQVGLAAHMDAFRTQVPHAFQPTSRLDAHHGAFRFRWRFAAPDGSVFAEGLTVGQVGADHKIDRLIHFVDATE
jgi:hypothetical protein